MNRGIIAKLVLIAAGGVIGHQYGDKILGTINSVKK